MSFCIYVDGDGCPVREQIYKVAIRFGVKVFVVSASSLKVKSPIENIVVGRGFDAADDEIVRLVSSGDLVITGDLELAYRSLKKNSFAIDFKGNEFTDDNIGDIMAKRELMAKLRDTQFESEKKIKQRAVRDDSVFANKLNNLIQRLIKEKGKSQANG